MAKIIPILFATYLAAIKNSVDSKLFRNVFAKVDGIKTDITEKGNLSCAFFVSSILLLFGLIKEIHTTVNGTVKDMEGSGWIEIQEPKVGCVIVWGKVDFGGGNFHKHIGFYMGEEKAVSNDSEQGVPIMHDWKFNGKREIEEILWDPNMENM